MVRFLDKRQKLTWRSKEGHCKEGIWGETERTLGTGE